MSDLLDTMELLLAPGATDTVSIYERAAPDYARFRELWLSLAGRECEVEMLEVLRSILRPDFDVLDAGCGTGALSRKLFAMEPKARLTMLDLTPAMLEQAADIPGEHIQGDVMALPFEDETFDLVTSAWCIETVPDAKRAVAEFLRVLKPDGFVLYTFCSLPDGFVSRAGTALLRVAVERGFAGKFLDREEAPVHDCDRSRILRFRHGLTTLVLLRKCCSVTPDGLPIPMSEVPQTGV